MANSMYNKAGSFKPKERANSGILNFGKSRDPEARGKFVAGWENALHTWVDCRAYIWGYDGNTYDITDDIVNGSLVRNTDAPTNMTITFTNEGDKYRQMFIPNDRIVLFLRRNETEWQSFTGYVHNTPIFNLYQSKELTLQCSCVIRRLNQKFWDPNYRENILVLAGGTPESSAPEITGSDTPEPTDGPTDEEVRAFFADDIRVENVEDDPATPEDESMLPPEGDMGAGNMITPDMTLAFLLTAPDHIGLKPEMVYIQKFPDAWKDRAAAITAANGPCMTAWEDLIVCPDDEFKDCADGGSEGATGDCEGATLGSVVDAAGFTGSRREEAIQVAYCESTANAGAANTTAAGRAAGGPLGLFQIVLTTAQSVDSSATPEKLLDPFYNAEIAKKLVDQDGGWRQWACKPGVGQYGKGKEDTPIIGCPKKSANAELTPGSKPTADKPIGGENPDNIEGDDEFSPDSAGCGTGAGSSEPGGQTGSGKAPNGWHLVDINAMEMRVKINTRHADDVRYAMTEWNRLGGVKIIESGNPTVTVSDGSPQSGAAATTSSNGHITVGPNWGRATTNAQRGMMVHEFGHALGFGHQTSQPSVMQPSFTSNSNNNPDKPTKFDQNLYAETWGTGGGIKSGNVIAMENVNTPRNTIELFEGIVNNAYRTPYRWGGGHGDIRTQKDLIERGSDASGLFNSLRRIAGFENWNIGGVVDYFKFLEDIEPFNENRIYPPGTILINPGSKHVMGHMAMVYNMNGNVIEANGRKGLYNEFTVKESNSNWSGYTHVGKMPDVETIEIPIPDSFKNHDPYVGIKRTITSNVSIQAAGGCDDSKWDYSATGRTTTNYSPLIRSVADKVAEQWDISHNTYVGHPGGEPNSIDFWGPARRGADLSDATGNAIKDYLVENYSNKINWLIWNGRMLSPGGWGPDTSGWGHYDHLHVTMGSPDCGGATVEGAGNDAGGGDEGDKGIDAAFMEPCITRHPLGVYKLAWEAIAESSGESSVLADIKRILSLTNGSMTAAKDEVAKIYPEDEYERFVEIWEEATEERDWEHLAELNKEPYMATIQDVADYGMYTMMSIGTGEIVFWYPWIVEYFADYVGQSKEEREAQPGDLTRTEIQNLYRRYPALQAYDISGYNRQQLAELFPKLNNNRASEEIAQQIDLSGLPLGRTNVNVLTDFMKLRDIDLQDFSLYVSDDPLVTHMFVLGQYRWQGGTYGGLADLQCYRWSTIFDHPLMIQQAKTTPHWDPNLFIQRYGVRSKSEQNRSIKIPGMAQIWAEQQFLRQWLNCYLIQLSTSFLPELYPGQRLEIEPLGIMVVILQVSHTFGSEWSTQLTVSQPIQVTDDSKIPPLPFWTLFTAQALDEGLDPTAMPEGLGLTDSIPIDAAPLGTEGDLWEQINAKRKEENKRLRAYLDYWAGLRNNPDLMKDSEEFYKEHPGMARPPGPIRNETRDGIPGFEDRRT